MHILHIFVRVQWKGIGIRIVLINTLAFLPFEVQAKHDDMTDKLKCTEADPRKVYPYCMMFKGILWCDQSSYQRMPTVEEINDHLIDGDCRRATVLNINDSCLTDIEKGGIQQFMHVIDLNVESNRVTKLHEAVFNGNKELRYLNARRNKISKVDRSAFLGLRNLTSLNLAHNEIRELEIGTFRDTMNLEMLCLDNNLLSEIQGELFGTLTRLKALRMTGNEITRIHRNAFNGMSSLTHLHLAGNKLHNVSGYEFRQLWNLEVLNVSFNGIRNWPASYGQILVNVRTLDLGHNMLSKFSSNHLSNMTKLQHLSLKGNSLSEVEANLFDTTPSLSQLDMSDNSLEDIPDNAFSQLCQLSHLSLSNNTMKTPRKQWWERFCEDETTIRTSLSENTWDCGCQSEEYWNYLQDLTSRSDQLPFADIECTSPKKHKGRKLSELTESDFESCHSAHTNAKQVAPSQELPIIVCLLLSALTILLLFLVWYCRATNKRGSRKLHDDESWIRHNRLDEECCEKLVA